MFSKINKTKKSFIGAIAMSLMLLMGSALGVLLETNLNQIAPPSVGTWESYSTKPSGNGSNASPYIISTPSELAYLINNLGAGTWSIELASDIDLGGHEWVPIKTTVQNTVTFNGNGHTISNMKIKQPKKDGSGLFEGNFKNASGEREYTTLHFSNTNFANVDIYSYRCTGVVVAEMREESLIENVNVLSGKIFQSGEDFIGGIIGYSFGTVRNCTNNASLINNNSVVGGIVGGNRGTVENCINTGDLVCHGTYIGGIVGQNAGMIRNCYAECKITGVKRIGGIASYMSEKDTESSIINSGFNGEIFVEAEEQTYVGAMAGSDEKTKECLVENCFGVANIYFRNTNDTSSVFNYGTNGKDTIKNCYSYSHIYTREDEVEYRKYKGNNFNEFAYHENINGGYPFPRSLFAVGQFIDCDTLSYLKSYEFDNLKYAIFNDGTHYSYYMGQYPQTYVGDSLNYTLKSWYTSTNPESVDEFTNENITHYAYKYTDGNTYVRVASAITNGSGYKFQDDATVAVNGSEYWFKVEPIKWWVLNYDEVKNNNVNPILLAERGLTANIKWNKSNDAQNLWSGTSNIRSWLNNTFYNDAFDTEAKGNIKTTTLKNNTQSSLADGTGVDTQDNIWFLSNNEADGGFECLNSKTKRVCVPTDYAIVNNCYLSNNKDVPVEIRPNGVSCHYWLRSAEMSTTYVARVVGVSGAMTYGGVQITDVTVRPALTLDI